MCISPQTYTTLQTYALGSLVSAAGGYIGTAFLTNIAPSVGALYGGIFGITYSLVSTGVAWCFEGKQVNKLVEFAISFFASIAISSYLTSWLTGVTVTFGIGCMLTIATIIPIAIAYLCLCPERVGFAQDPT